VLGGCIEERLKEVIREVVDEKGGLGRGEVMPDQVHLLVTTGGAPLAAVKRYVEQQKDR
jgi:putative transposase